MPTNDWSEFIPPGRDPKVVELAGKWKHGWIPLDATATASKMKNKTGGKKWWSGKSSGGGARRVAGGGGKKKADPMAEMHARMSQQKPESRSTIMRRAKKAGPSTAYDRGGPADSNSLGRNPSNSEYHAALGQNADGSLKGKKKSSRDSYFDALGVKSSERPAASNDMSDDEYYKALGMPNPNRVAPAPSSSFKGTKPGTSQARRDYESKLPKKLSATKHHGAGAEWVKKPGTKTYELHKNGKPVLDQHTKAVVTSNRETIARSLRGQTLRSESGESRKVHNKNFQKAQISSGHAPLTSGQRKTIAARGTADRAASLRANLGKAGPLEGHEAKRITHLNSLKKNSPRAFTAQHQQELDHLNARKAQHGRHEYKAGNKTGRIIGGGKGKA